MNKYKQKRLTYLSERERKYRKNCTIELGHERAVGVLEKMPPLDRGDSNVVDAVGDEARGVGVGGR